MTRGTGHYEYLFHIQTGGGVVGKLFGAYEATKEQRAVDCVNALAGVPEEVITSEWFRKEVLRIAKTNGYADIPARRAYSRIQQEAINAEETANTIKRYDKKMKARGRAGGLRYALQQLKKFSTWEKHESHFVSDARSGSGVNGERRPD